KLFYMVFVGALNVGQLVFGFENRVETNKDAKEIKVYNYDNNEITKGECLGYLKMGSTVVMIWEKDSVQIDNILNQNVE
ncbi:phosphatidylserine decarboxylase, partial [Aliarcobacter butzleri]|uniref:phosphatidylserine decarboxylase n=1 Tax=Aliarcobacter butzleri TaxID=28197 RepID=UPI003AF9B97C